jgi:hypothetical protein
MILRMIDGKWAQMARKGLILVILVQNYVRYGRLKACGYIQLKILLFVWSISSRRHFPIPAECKNSDSKFQIAYNSCGFLIYHCGDNFLLQGRNQSNP